MTFHLASFFFSNAWDSPFVVPVAGCFMILGIVVAGSYRAMRARELESQERMAAIAKGLPLPPTQAELALTQTPQPVAATHRRRASTRQGGIVLVGVAVGLILFFFALWAVLQERAVLCGAAVGLIPLGIGIGLLIDASIQKREAEAANSTAP